MSDPLLLPSIALPPPLPLYLPTPKFQIGQWVCWKQFQYDFGYVTGVCWAAEGSVQIAGFHYAVLLDQYSPSRRLGIELDYAFEDDLAIREPVRSLA